MTAVELTTDAKEWLAMEDKNKKQYHFEIHFHDDEERLEVRKHKLPTTSLHTKWPRRASPLNWRRYESCVSSSDLTKILVRIWDPTA
jgi:hypothetical protein